MCQHCFCVAPKNEHGMPDGKSLISCPARQHKLCSDCFKRGSCGCLQDPLSNNNNDNKYEPCQCLSPTLISNVDHLTHNCNLCEKTWKSTLPIEEPPLCLCDNPAKMEMRKRSDGALFWVCKDAPRYKGIGPRLNSDGCTYWTLARTVKDINDKPETKDKPIEKRGMPDQLQFDSFGVPLCLCSPPKKAAKIISKELPKTTVGMWVCPDRKKGKNPSEDYGCSFVWKFKTPRVSNNTTEIIADQWTREGLKQLSYAPNCNCWPRTKAMLKNLGNSMYWICGGDNQQSRCYYLEILFTRFPDKPLTVEETTKTKDALVKIFDYAPHCNCLNPARAGLFQKGIGPIYWKCQGTRNSTGFRSFSQKVYCEMMVPANIVFQEKPEETEQPSSVTTTTPKTCNTCRKPISGSDIGVSGTCTSCIIFIAEERSYKERISQQNLADPTARSEAISACENIKHDVGDIKQKLERVITAMDFTPQELSDTSDLFRRIYSTITYCKCDKPTPADLDNVGRKRCCDCFGIISFGLACICKSPSPMPCPSGDWFCFICNRHINNEADNHSQQGEKHTSRFSFRICIDIILATTSQSLCLCAKVTDSTRRNGQFICDECDLPFSKEKAQTPICKCDPQEFTIREKFRNGNTGWVCKNRATKGQGCGFHVMIDTSKPSEITITRETEKTRGSPSAPICPCKARAVRATFSTGNSAWVCSMRSFDGNGCEFYKEIAGTFNEKKFLT